MRIQKGHWGRQEVRKKAVKENLRINSSQLSGTSLRQTKRE